METMSKTSDQLDSIQTFLTGGATLTNVDAKSMFDIDNLPQRIADLRKKRGMTIDTTRVDVNGVGINAYIIGDLDPAKLLPKMLRVTPSTDIRVKEIKLKKQMNGDPMTEGQIYIRAVEIGLATMMKS